MRVRGGNWWSRGSGAGEMETTVYEQQLKKKKVYREKSF